MNIGIDFDGVIFDFEKMLRVEAEIYDYNLKQLGLQNGIKDNNAYGIQSRYNWTKEYLDKFIDIYFAKASRASGFISGAKQVIDILKLDGHNIIIISARGGFNDEEIVIAKEKIKEEGLEVDEINWKVQDKSKMCKEKNIDLMIDDNFKICKSLSENNIKTLYLRDKTNRTIEENGFIQEVSNWGEIYRIIKELEINKNN